MVECSRTTTADFEVDAVQPLVQRRVLAESERPTLTARQWQCPELVMSEELHSPPRGLWITARPHSYRTHFSPRPMLGAMFSHGIRIDQPEGAGEQIKVRKQAVELDWGCFTLDGTPSVKCAKTIFD